ncbi:MAG: thiamine-phosphate pyrophosphorylase [Flavipsychrobacter sp.]|jgi:thiamine-phosphate pyrophosphorylase|nr:thiamine-phosphate pyrophosphorylase [Flavipsychrobacter sp.]
MRPISKLQFITTNPRLAEQACLGGINWIQLRLKNTPDDEFISIAREVQAVCRQFNATFIINDNVTMAFNLQADGVHLGKEDMSPDVARQLLGRNFIVGCTANTIEDVTYLSSKPINYIGLGPYRFTSTKQKLSPILGIEGYRNIFAQLQQRQINTPPVIGIGGITHNDIPELLATGLHGVAVSGAISGAANITLAAQQLKNSLFTIYNNA